MTVLDTPNSVFNSLFATERFLKLTLLIGNFSPLFHSTCQTCSENQLFSPLQKVESGIFVPSFVSLFIPFRFAEKFPD
jgi:hypothetical protein